MVRPKMMRAMLLENRISVIMLKEPISTTRITGMMDATLLLLFNINSIRLYPPVSSGFVLHSIVSKNYKVHRHKL